MSTDKSEFAKIPTIFDAEIEQFQSECINAGIDKYLLKSLALHFKGAASLEECRQTMSYLHEKLDSLLQFNVAAELIILTGQLWRLQPSSLLFFEQLAHHRRDIYFDVCEHLKTFCTGQGLFLKAHHLDTVIERLQQHLPIDALETLSAFVAEHPELNGEAFKRQLLGLRAEKLPWIAKQASLSQLSHHNLNHAYEVKIRAARAAEVLGLLQADSVLDKFLLRIILLAIECHDFIQTTPGLFATVELASAAEVSKWLEALIQPPPAVKQIIDLIVHDIIVLGTTMIYSPTSTLDLSELFFFFAKRAIPAGIHTHLPDHEQHPLMRQIYAMMIITGVCDKMPAAIYEVVRCQAEQPATNSLLNLKHYYPGQDLLVEQFLTDERYFKPYYLHKSLEANQQAFLMSIVPHLCMRIELSRTKEPIAVGALVNFICDAQQLYRLNRGTEVLMGFFANQLKNQAIFDAVELLFFSTIESEVNFCNSQVGTLNAGLTKLIEMNFLDETGQPYETKTKLDASIKAYPKQLMIKNPGDHNWPLEGFIDPSIPQTDAHNLSSLGRFYRTLSSTMQQHLIAELLLNIVLQAGAIYINQPHLGLSSDPGTPLELYTPGSKGMISRNWRADFYGKISPQPYASPRTFTAPENRDVITEQGFITSEDLEIGDDVQQAHFLF